MTTSGSREIHVVGAALLRGARCLVVRRSATMSNPLKWEFPGGKVEPGESPQEALHREIREELGMEIQVGAFLGTGTGDGDGRRIRLDVFLASSETPSPSLREHCEFQWLDRSRLGTLDWAEADIPVVPVLRDLLEAGGDSGPA